MGNLERILETTPETLTIIVDTNRRKMSIRVGEDKTPRVYDSYTEDDFATLKGHASKVWGANGLYTYVVYPKAY